MGVAVRVRSVGLFGRCRAGAFTSFSVERETTVGYPGMTMAFWT